MLLPGVTTLARLVAGVRDRAAARLWHRLAQVPDAAQHARLEARLVVPEGARQTPLERLRQAPTRVSAAALVAALKRLAEVRALGVGPLDLTTIPPGRMQALARHAIAAKAQTIGLSLAFRRDFTIGPSHETAAAPWLPATTWLLRLVARRLCWMAAAPSAVRLSQGRGNSVRYWGS